MMTNAELKQCRVEYNKKYYKTHREEILLKAKIKRTTMSPEKYKIWREQIRQSYYKRKAEKQKLKEGISDDSNT